VHGAIRRLGVKVHGGRGTYTSGRYYPADHRVHVTARQASVSEVSLVLLHELVHAAHDGRGLRRRDGGRSRWHCEAYHRMLLAAASEAYALRTEEVGAARRAYAAEGGARRAYSMDCAIESLVSRRLEPVERAAA
jgi:hypothetical protein